MNEADVGLIVEPSIWVRYEAVKGESHTGLPDEIGLVSMFLSLGDGSTVELTAEQEKRILALYRNKIEEEILNGRAN
jgi:hypothetical protein